jgi:hypothetical protein
MQEEKFRSQISDLAAAFEVAFLGIAPPEPRWFSLWLAKYPLWAIKDAIGTLSKHPLKPRFTTESCGKALSALLRAEALKRATASVPNAGGVR